jgi:hypothetical protein
VKKLIPSDVLILFQVFLRLGLTSFGGPIAHLGYFRQEFVATKLCTDRTRITFAFVATVIILLTNSSWVQVLTIALGALAGWKLIRAEAPPEKSEMFTRLPNRVQSISSLVVFAFCLLIVPVVADGKRDGWLPLFDSFYRTGSLVFAAAMLFSRFCRLKLYRRAGWTTTHSWLDMASLRRCQVHCFLLRPISGPLRPVLPPVGWQGSGVFSRFFCHPCFWLRDCSRSGIDFELPPWILVVIGAVLGGIFL